MKDKPYKLGISFGKYHDPFDVPWDLYEASTEQELDEFTRKFSSDKEIRRLFDQKIGECALEDREKIEKNETKHHNFRGRICAYYYDKNNRINYIEVAYKKRKIVRDYRDLVTLKEREDFLETVFNEIIKSINYENKHKKMSVNEKMFIVIKTFEKYGYSISDNEKYYLACFFYKPNIKTKSKLFLFIKINLKDEYLKEKEDIEDQKKLSKEYDIPKKDYLIYDTDDLLFNELFNKAIKENDFDLLFKYYTVDEINKKCNYFEVEKEGKKLCIK